MIAALGLGAGNAAQPRDKKDGARVFTQVDGKLYVESDGSWSSWASEKLFGKVEAPIAKETVVDLFAAPYNSAVGGYDHARAYSDAQKRRIVFDKNICAGLLEEGVAFDDTNNCKQIYTDWFSMKKAEDDEHFRKREAQREEWNACQLRRSDQIFKQGINSADAEECAPLP